MSNKMGFAAVLAIVFGSQIGAGILTLPSQLAPYGMFGVYGWILAGAEAMLLAFIFSELCSIFPITGGPHIYVQKTFGNTAAFFTGWTYWVASLVSNIVLVITAVGCLAPFFPSASPFFYTILEIMLLLILMWINCTSLKLSGKLETVLTLLKFIPFALVPLAILGKFDASNINLLLTHADQSSFKLLISVLSASFFCFIGVECATTPAGSVENPSKTIPRAILLGTFCVTLIYFVNNLAIMGIVSSEILAKSSAPFVDAVRIAFGANISVALAIITSIVIVGTLNAWIITSSQISLSLARDNFLPKIIAKCNRAGSPYVSVALNCLLMIPLLLLTKSDSISEQILYIIDLSVLSFVFVYIICTFSYLKIVKSNLKRAIGYISLVICFTIIEESTMSSIIISILFSASGLFLIFFSKKNK